MDTAGMTRLLLGSSRPAEDSNPEYDDVKDPTDDETAANDKDIYANYVKL